MKTKLIKKKTVSITMENAMEKYVLLDDSILLYKSNGDIPQSIMGTV